MINSMLGLLIIAVFGTGCATMISPDKTAVYIKSEKKGQAFIVKNNKGVVIAKATTPAIIKLDNKGDSTYTYLTQCETKHEESELNGWVLGNLIMVSITGMLIDLENGYYNAPAEKVSLLDCDRVLVSKKERLIRSQDCGDHVHKYDRSVYNFNDKKNKDAIYDLKYTQDYLLNNCSNYVDISHYKKQETTINGVYESYL